MISEINLLQSGDMLGISRDRQMDLIAKMALLAAEATMVADLVDMIVRQKDMTEIEKIFFAFGGGVAQTQFVKALPRPKAELPTMFMIRTDDPAKGLQAALDIMRERLRDQGGPDL